MCNVAIGDPGIGETFPAAPVAWDGRVYIGNAGGDNFGVTAHRAIQNLLAQKKE